MWFRKRWLAKYFNYLYVGEWLALLVLLVILSAVFPSRWWLLATPLVFWRTAEILIWYVKMLLDAGHDLMISVERNLLFLALNMVEVALALAFLLGLCDLGEPESLRASISVLTLNGLGYEGGGWATFVLFLGTISGLIIIAAGLALLIGIIGERFHDEARPYQGGTRPPKPGQGDFYKNRERLLPREEKPGPPG